MTPIQRLLDEGVPEEDLHDMVEGSAKLVEVGKQHPRFWYPENLFGGTSMQRWLADIAAFEAGVPDHKPTQSTAPSQDLDEPDPEAEEIKAYMEYGKRLVDAEYSRRTELPDAPLARSQRRPRRSYTPYTGDAVLVTKSERDGRHGPPAASSETG